MLVRRREIARPGRRADRLEDRLQPARDPGAARHRRPAGRLPHHRRPARGRRRRGRSATAARWSSSPRWRWSWATTGARSPPCCRRSRWPTRPTSSRTSRRSWPATSSTAPWPSARAWRRDEPGRGAHPRQRRGASTRSTPSETGARLDGDGGGGGRRAWPTPASSCARASASSPASSRRRTPPQPGDTVRLELDGAGRRRAALRARLRAHDAPPPRPARRPLRRPPAPSRPGRTAW